MSKLENNQALELIESIYQIDKDELLSNKQKVNKYKKILDDVISELLSSYKSQIIGLTSKIIFLLKNQKPSKEIRDILHRIRMLINITLYSNDESKEEDSNIIKKLLIELIASYSDIHINNRLTSIELEEILINKKQSIDNIKASKYSMFVIVDSIQDFLEYIVLYCYSDDAYMSDLLSIKIENYYIQNNYGIDNTDIKNYVTEYSKLYISDLVEIESKEYNYKTTERSYIVYEPDYLIDVTELAECSQSLKLNKGLPTNNSLIYNLKMFLRSETTDKMLIGSIVGKMLDDIIINKDCNMSKSFETIMRDNSLKMLCLANKVGSYDRALVKQIYDSAMTHESNLRHILDQNFNDTQKLIVEPTFISNKYGLLGRLDILVANENGNFDIVELKSTAKPPMYGLWNNHESQTLCYDLLISSVYPERKGISSILYSNDKQNPIRNVAEERYTNKQNILMLRNKIVSNDISLSKGDLSVISKILNSNSDIPKYLFDASNEFQNKINSLSGVYQKYFLGFINFIYKELVYAKIGENDKRGFADLWRLNKNDKIENFDILIDLHIEEITNDFHISLSFANKDLFSDNSMVSSFREGDSAIIYPIVNDYELNPLSTQILKCRVVSINEEKIVVSLVNKQQDKEFFEQKMLWALEKDFRDTGYKQQLKQLYEFVSADKSILDLALGLERPLFNEDCVLLDNTLDNSQNNEVKMAVLAKNYYLIQGPPGTGKTSKVLMEIIRNLNHNNLQIMVIAFTNRAVDEICNKLESLDIEFIRLGKSEKSYSWSNLASKYKLNELNDKLHNVPILVSTIASLSMNSEVLTLKKFDTLIIDEASQVLEPQINGFLKYFKKWIFIGDENQLPAVVLQNDELSKVYDTDLLDISLSSFSESLFYRLKYNAIQKGWSNCYGSLKYHYRMHQDIAKFSNENFYNKELIPNSNRQTIINDFNDISFLPDKRVLFINTPIDDKSKINTIEANIIKNIVDKVVEYYGESFDPKKTIGVITPFRAQIANIKNTLGKKYQNIDVDTVERFQGSERDIIIVSFAINKASLLKNIQSINYDGVDRKLNVAITRAKEKLILLGTEEILSKSDILSKLIETIKFDKGYVTYDELKDIN